MVALADSQSDVGVDASFRLTLPYERLILGDFKTLGWSSLRQSQRSTLKLNFKYGVDIASGFDLSRI